MQSFCNFEFETKHANPHPDRQRRHTTASLTTLAIGWYWQGLKKRTWRFGDFWQIGTANQGYTN
jgi:hypothetical protein